MKAQAIAAAFVFAMILYGNVAAIAIVTQFAKGGAAYAPSVAILTIVVALVASVLLASLSL